MLHGMNGYGWGMMGLGWFVGLLLLILVIWLLVRLFTLGYPSHHTHHHDKTPLDILKERYAKGEIDKQEFEDRKKDIKDS
jgi:putative membrane protein